MDEANKKAIRQTVGLIGFCLIGFSVGTYFENLKTGICVSLFLFGVGFVIDALKK